MSAEGGSVFMGELLEAIAEEVHGLGARASFHVGTFPDDEEAVFVVVPHEYFALTPSARRPSVHQMSRTVGFCVEHPGNATFEVSARWAARLAAAVDINRDGTAELSRRGVDATRIVLGYSTRWDRWGGDPGVDRPVDITYLGTTDRRRDQLLAHQARQLSRWSTVLLVPPHEQMTAPRPDFLVGDAKLAHLSSSKILLNLHRGGSDSIEWVRVLEAICNGCVVVSEHSRDFEPLVPGRHLVFGRGLSTARVASALLLQPDRLEQIRADAYTLCRESLRMSQSAATLLEVAERVSSRRRSVASARPSDPVGGRRPALAEPPRPDAEVPVSPGWVQYLPCSAREALATLVRRAGSLPALWAEESCELMVAPPHGLAGSAPPEGVDAVVVGRKGSDRLAATLRGLASQTREVRVLMRVVAAPGDGLGLPVGRLRNEMVAESSGSLVLFVDPGQELFPGALQALVDALVADPACAASYGMMADQSSGRLWNCLPVELHRLEHRVYLGAPVLVRRSALSAAGAFSEDPLLAGFEDHDLWLRLASRGMTGALVPSILGVGERRRPVAASLPSLVPAGAAALLREAVLGGAREVQQVGGQA